MIMSLVLFENEFLHIVSISFTALILNELIMVAIEITTWYVVSGLTSNVPLTSCVLRHIYMVVSEIVTLFFYVISIAFLPAYFGMNYFSLVVSSKNDIDEWLADLSFVVTPTFAWKVAVIVAISALPLYILKLIKRKVAPAASSKLL